MREKRYYKGMKGTQEQKKERYPFLDVLPLKRKAIREINEREGGFEEDGAITESEERKEKVKEIIREVFAGAGLELKETERGNYTTAFSIKGKLII